MPDHDDQLGAAMSGGGSHFPEAQAGKTPGAAAWDDFRAKKAGSSWDAVIAGVNAQFGLPAGVNADALAAHTPAAYAPAAPRADGGTWQAPAGGAAAPAQGDAWSQFRAARQSGDQNMPLNPMSAFSSPAMAAERFLPEPALEKYRTLCEGRDEAFLLANGISKEIEGERLQIVKNSVRLKELRGEIGNFRPAAEDHPTVVGAVEHEAHLKAAIARLEARRQPHIDKANAIGTAVNSVDRYIGETVRRSGSKLKEVTPPKIGKADTIAIVAERIEQLRADIHEVNCAMWPSEDAKRRAIAEVDFLASKGKIGVQQSLHHRNQLRWPGGQRDVPNTRIELRGFGKGRDDLYDVSLVSTETAIACWLHRDAIVARICAEIDEYSDDENALSAEQRGAALARLNGSILAEMRVLGAIIWRDSAFAEIPIDLDPRALLGVDGPAPREA